MEVSQIKQSFSSAAVHCIGRCCVFYHVSHLLIWAIIDSLVIHASQTVHFISCGMVDCTSQIWRDFCDLCNFIHCDMIIYSTT